MTMLEHQSRKAASLANDTLINTGKTVWRDLKDVYAKKSAKNEGQQGRGCRIRGRRGVMTARTPFGYQAKTG
jgi:hypothetical protein